jgi:hypothetical protein
MRLGPIWMGESRLIGRRPYSMFGLFHKASRR